MFKANGKNIALSLVLLGVAPFAFAQSSGDQFSDETLESYVEARSEIREVSRSYQQQMEEADSRDQAQQLQQEMRDEMIQAVEASGISVDQYNAITQQAQQDRELRSRLSDLN